LLAIACPPPEHSEGELRPVRPGFENIHVVYGRFPIVSSCRHIREIDSFVHVDPKYLGIEE
jgi:hypothetical protein